MKFTETITQEGYLTKEKKQELGLYFLYSTLEEDDKIKLKSFFETEISLDILKKTNNFNHLQKNKYNLLSIFEDWKHKLPSDLIINEDEFYN